MHRMRDHPLCIDAIGAGVFAVATSGTTQLRASIEFGMVITMRAVGAAAVTGVMTCLAAGALVGLAVSPASAEERDFWPAGDFTIVNPTSNELDLVSEPASGIHLIQVPPEVPAHGSVTVDYTAESTGSPSYLGESGQRASVGFSATDGSRLTVTIKGHCHSYSDHDEGQIGYTVEQGTVTNPDHPSRSGVDIELHDSMGDPTSMTDGNVITFVDSQAHAQINAPAVMHPGDEAPVDLTFDNLPPYDARRVTLTIAADLRLTDEQPALPSGWTLDAHATTTNADGSTTYTYVVDPMTATGQSSVTLPVRVAATPSAVAGPTEVSTQMQERPGVGAAFVTAASASYPITIRNFT